MTNKTLYEIWQTKPPYRFPVKDALVHSPFYRDEVVSVDYDRLKVVCYKLNEMTINDYHYEIWETELAGATLALLEQN